MPQALIFTPLASFLFSVGAPIAVVNAAYGIGIAGAIFQGAVGAAALMGTSALVSSFAQKPSIPTPEDGKYNFKQSVPSRTFAYGRVKKGADYVFLEERAGVAYHVLAYASHEIDGFVRFYLHDTPANLDENGVVTSVDSPDEDSDKYYVLGTTPIVTFQSRSGLPLETAYQTLIDEFSDIIDGDYRGDGIASILMKVASVSSQSHMSVFPHNMPIPTAIADCKKVYDPRTGITAFSRNLALIRLDHLLAQYGGKLELSDMNLESWKRCADVCDSLVTNRNGDEENRYYGGLWARYENDPVDVGRLIDEAGEMVLYETEDGKVAVHPGEWVEPDIHLTEKDISNWSYDANLDPSKTVLAVRGRWIDPSQDYNEVDAAIYGNPYASDNDERTVTKQNVVVQSHNHIWRMQALQMMRKNAPKVSFSCDYFAARGLPQRRFIKVTKEPYVNEAYVEILGRPTLQLKGGLKYSVEGIVVPKTMYDESTYLPEGEPGSIAAKIGSSGIPDVEDFFVEIESEQVASGTVAARAHVSFTRYSEALTYELEYGVVGETATVTQIVADGSDDLDTSYLADGKEYEFRMRARSPGGSAGDWTEYITLTAIADPTAPGSPTDFDMVGGVGEAVGSWGNPNSENLISVRLYRNSVDDFSTASMVGAIYNGATSFTDSPVAAGDHFYWVVAANGSGIESAELAALSNPITVS